MSVISLKSLDYAYAAGIIVDDDENSAARLARSIRHTIKTEKSAIL